MVHRWPSRALALSRPTRRGLGTMGLAALGCSGCVLQSGAGYQTPMGSFGQDHQAAVEVHLDFVADDNFHLTDPIGVMVGPAARVQIDADGSSQGSVASGVLLLLARDDAELYPVTPYLRAGAHLLQLGRGDVGMGSPFGDLGMMITPDMEWPLWPYVSASAELDVWFGDRIPEGFASFQGGLVINGFTLLGLGLH